MPSVLELKARAGRVAPLISTSSASSIADVLVLLVENNILSCPVVDAGHCVAMIDKLDLATYILQTPEYSTGNQDTPISALQHSLKHVLDSPEYQRRQHFRPLPATSTVSDVFKELTEVHRVPLLDEGGAVVAVITQSDLIQIAHANLAKLGSVVNQTVESLRITAGIARAPLITTPASTAMGEALLILARNHIQGMPVIDSAGKFLYSFSTSQLKSGSMRDLDHRTFTFYRRPLSDYLAKLGTPELTIDPGCTLGALLAKLVESRVHRAYALDPAGAPLYVVSMSDVLMALAPAVHNF